MKGDRETRQTCIATEMKGILRMCGRVEMLWRWVIRLRISSDLVG